MSRLRHWVLILAAVWSLHCASARESNQPRPAEIQNSSGSVTIDISAGQIAQIDSERIPVGNSYFRGSRSALVTIVEFGDFECPFCGRAQPTLRALRERYGSDVRVVWKNNPLDFHEHAMLAAEASLAAGAQGKFWEMHDVIFENQSNLNREDLERYALAIGLNMPRFQGDLDQHSFRAQIEADQRLALSLGVEGAPIFYLNGTKFVGAQPVDRFVSLIDSILSTARVITPREQVYARMTRNPLASPDPPPVHRAPRVPTDDRTVYRVPVDGSPSIGNRTALVTIVEFSDFQCPFCGMVEGALASVRAQYGSDVRIVWKNLPLPFHSNASVAAEAALEAFAQQGNAGFFRYHDTLFQHQRERDGLNPAALEHYAALQQLDLPRFRRALRQHTHLASIQSDATLADQLGAGGTPTFFINGRMLIGAQPIDAFRQLIDEVRTAAQQSLNGATPDAGLYDRLVGQGATAPAQAQ